MGLLGGTNIVGARCKVGVVEQVKRREEGQYIHTVLVNYCTPCCQGAAMHPPGLSDIQALGKAGAAPQDAWLPTCLQALLHSSHMFAEAKHSFASHGILVDNPRVDVDAMMKQKSNAVSGLTKGIEGLFKKNKVEGRGRGGANAIAGGSGAYGATLVLGGAV